MNKFTAIYVRVSSLDQKLEVQLEDLQKLAEYRGFKEVKVFSDKATGTNLDRPGFQKMMKAVAGGQVENILIWRLDRLCRSIRDLMSVVEILKTNHVTLISHRDNIDLSTNIGMMITQILGVFAEFEANTIRERVRAGVKKAQANGVKFGRPTKIDFQEVKRMQGQGLGVCEVARRLGASKGSISNWFKKPA